MKFKYFQQQQLMGDATKGWGLGIYYHSKTKWKIQPKEVASCLIPYLLIVYTQVLENISY